MAKDYQELHVPQSGFIESKGLQIYFKRFGAGQPMILVHGWGADTRSNWVDSGWIEVLETHRMVISIDIRGHGKSDKPHALPPYSYAAMSQDVLAVMEAHGIEEADFMGYSMGSFIGAYLLGHHPERFTSMILGGIGDETESSAAQGGAIAQALRAPDLASISDAAGKRIRAFVESNPGNDLESLAYSALKMWPEGYPLKIAGSNIAQAQFPVLIVNGENDHPYVDSADQLAAALPNARHLRITGTDHLTTVSDERFKKAVVEFLGK
jgi:pimeloyl-ACP methyl ester carboxylesterase